MVSVLSVAFSGALAMATATGPTVAPTSPSPSPSIPTPSELILLAPERRVRAADPRVQALLADGFRRSQTFAGLLLAINRTDVIVYVERVMSLPKDTLGRLAMVPIAKSARYLRIQIRAELPHNDAIALIGHEMQHALEIARDTTVRDQNGMITLYERIGHSSGGEHVYDTVAAQDTGRQVRKELTMPVSLVFRGDLSGLSVRSASPPADERK